MTRAKTPTWRPAWKVCPGCKRRRYRQSYSPDPSHHDGLASTCRECRNEYNREVYAERGRPDRPKPERLRYPGEGYDPPPEVPQLRVRCYVCRTVVQLPVPAWPFARGWICPNRKCLLTWGCVWTGPDELVDVVWIDVPRTGKHVGDQVILTWANARARIRRQDRDAGVLEAHDVPANPLRMRVAGNVYQCRPRLVDFAGARVEPESLT